MLNSLKFMDHVIRQIAFSKGAFGPGLRTQGVIDHIRKELIEVEESNGSVQEWTDVVILALDGLWRAVENDLNSNDFRIDHKVSSDVIAFYTVGEINSKQGINENRVWPDWRTADPNKAIEHDRTGEDK